MPFARLRVEDFEREREPFTGRKLVVYCTIGFRSGRYASKLRAEGWNAANLIGVSHLTFADNSFVGLPDHLWDLSSHAIDSGYYALDLSAAVGGPFP